MVDYLKTRKVVVYEGQDDLNRNEAFEHLARHLGTHFDLLSEFYEKVKRCVATGRGQRIDIDGYSQASRSAAVQFGTLLHRHGMLKDFYYHRSPKKQLRVIPTKDGEIGQFLTGGWLEIYVFAVLAKRLKAAMPESKFQLLANVKGMLEDGREFEADLMAFVDGKFFWLECKTGNWQDYSARFRGLVKIFGVDRTSGGLLLIRPPDAATRARATDMLEMTLLSLADVDDYISIFLGEKPTGDSRRHVVHTETDEIPEEEVPLEDAPPARKLGAVSLDGEEAPASSSTRRRRRRRGGRGRGRGRSAQAAAEGEKDPSASHAPGDREGSSGSRSGRSGEGSSERNGKGKLLEPLPIEKFDDAEAGAKDASSEEPKRRSNEPREEDVATGEQEASGSGTRRRRRRRKSSPFAEDQAGSEAKADAPVASESEVEAEEATSGDASAEDPVKEAAPVPEPVAEAVEEAAAEEPEEEKAEEPEPEPEEAEEPVAELPEKKESKSGVTIAPDLAAMMAGTKPKED